MLVLHIPKPCPSVGCAQQSSALTRSTRHRANFDVAPVARAREGQEERDQRLAVGLSLLELQRLWLLLLLLKAKPGANPLCPPDPCFAS